MQLEPPVEIECPHCGERFTTFLDLSQGTTEYIEDCQICCKPILIQVRVDDLESEDYSVSVEPG